MAIGLSAVGVGAILLALLLQRSASARDTDPGSATTTLHGRIHNDAGIATFVLVAVSIVARTRTFRRRPDGSFSTPTVAWALCSIASFFCPLLGNAGVGLVQRIFVASWLTWMFATAA